MPINIISMDEESVLAEYVDRRGAVHPIPEILGDFADETEARLAALDEADRLGLVSAAQKMGMLSAIKSPRTREHMSRIGKRGMTSRWGPDR